MEINNKINQVQQKYNNEYSSTNWRIATTIKHQTKHTMKNNHKHEDRLDNIDNNIIQTSTIATQNAPENQNCTNNIKHAMIQIHHYHHK